MTEYDYSPEAYEKYLATQSRVSNWVSDQASRMPHYSNPFTPPSNAPSHVSTIAPQPVRAQHHSQLQPLRIPAVDSRSPPRSSPPKSSSRRSHTSPPPPLAPPPNHSQHYSRAAAERPRPAPTRSTTLPNAHMYQPVPPPTTQLVMRPPVHMAQVPPPPPGYKAEYRSYHYDPGRNEIVLPPMRPGETYVIVPPRRGAVEVVVSSPVFPQPDSDGTLT